MRLSQTPPEPDDTPADLSPFEQAMLLLEREPARSFALQARVSAAMMEVAGNVSPSSPAYGAAITAYVRELAQRVEDTSVDASIDLGELAAAVRELGSRPEELSRLRRAFARLHHPDAFTAEHYARANRLMQSANALIDDALKRTKP